VRAGDSRRAGKLPALAVTTATRFVIGNLNEGMNVRRADEKSSIAHLGTVEWCAVRDLPTRPAMWSRRSYPLTCHLAPLGNQPEGANLSLNL